MGEAAGGWAAVRARLSRDTREVMHLLTRAGTRRRFLRHLRAPGQLQVREQHALLLLVLLAGAAAWAAGRAALHPLAPDAARAWDTAWAFAGIGFLAAVAVPGTGTVALALLTDPAAAWPSIIGSAAGSAAGAAVVFFLGAALRGHLAARKHPHARRFLQAMARLARRGTYGALAVVVAIPGLPRWVPIYLASVVGLALAGFVAAVFAGSAVRAALVVFAADAFKDLL